MADMSTQKLADIAALIEKSSPETAARLLRMFERMRVKGSSDVPADGLLDAVRAAGHDLSITNGRTPGFDRMFYAAFEGIFEGGDPSALLPGSVSRSSLAPCWSLICDQVAPRLVERFGPEVRDSVLSGHQGLASQHVARFRQALLDHLQANTAGVQLLSSTKDAQPMGEMLLDLLLADAAIARLKAPLLTSIGDLSAAAEMALADDLLRFERESPVRAARFCLLLMTRLKRPAQVFRVLRKASFGVTDRKLEETDYAIVGHRLLAVAKRHLSIIERDAIEYGFDPAKMVAAVDGLGSVVTGFEREDILDDHGPWHAELMQIRQTAGSWLTKHCQRAAHEVTQALPIDRVRVKGQGMRDLPRMNAPPVESRVQRAAPLLRFVRDSRLYAALAGFASSRDRAHKDIERHLDQVSDALLADRRGTLSAHHDAWREALVTLVHAVEGNEAATLLGRRLAA